MSYSHLTTALRSPTHPLLLLRPLQARDAAALAALLSDRRNTEFEAPPPPEGTPPPAPMSEATAGAVIARMRESAGTPTVLGEGGGGGGGGVVSGPGRVNLAVVLLKQGAKGAAEEADEEAMVGLGGFGSIKDVREEAAGRVVRVGDVGVMISPAYRGLGLGAETIRLAVAWAFRPAAQGGLQLDRVTATTLTDNEAMLHLLEERLGLKELGKRRRTEEPQWKGFDPPKVEAFFELTPDSWDEVQRKR